MAWTARGGRFPRVPACTRFNKYLQRHSLKSGTEVRIKRGEAARFRFHNFFVNANATANTTSARIWRKSVIRGQASCWARWRTAPSAQYVPMQISDTEMYAMYLQDDFRIRDKLTLNLGLRWEYEGGLFDPEYRIPREVDLTQPIPGLQAAIDPRIPADIKAIMAESAGQNSYIYNGAYYFTDEENPRNAKVSPLQLMPRVGIAWSVNRQTAVRAGYGRFYTPQMLVNENATMGQLDLGAFSPTTPVLPDVQGVPQAPLSNPFPQGLTPAYGKRYGTNTSLGDNARWDEYRQRPAISDRFSFSVQREVWARTILDASYLMNFVSRDGYTKNLNMMDPRLSFKYGASLQTAVPNPFFQYGTVDTFPGALRSRPTVSVPICSSRIRNTSTCSRTGPTAARRAITRWSFVRSVRSSAVCQCSPGMRTCAAPVRSSMTTWTSTTAPGRGRTCRIRGTG